MRSRPPKAGQRCRGKEGHDCQSVEHRLWLLALLEATGEMKKDAGRILEVHTTARAYACYRKETGKRYDNAKRVSFQRDGACLKLLSAG